VVKRGEQDMLVVHIGEKTEMGKGVALIQSVESKGQVEVIMNRITLFLLAFALFMNILLVIVEITTPSTLNKCKNGAYEIQGCTKSEARKIISNFVVRFRTAAAPTHFPPSGRDSVSFGQVRKWPPLPESPGGFPPFNGTSYHPLIFVILALCGFHRSS
jgi:hypothetical protein